ncbi:tumor necrosis factor receptor superfamily member 9 isoform X2 [Rhinolophus ferrumequinum]|uniref:tumor necrosis factor receptor superfamily member 9 isoform X2 n=1 Tax=Rhinolophus ferrumequinum TaxID=59479 RepID=UPI00140F8434|nr:tumor necrosis factor receptor superfamily member 9 isoform X2 [Rhinolophus ferrumequinum]
MGSGFYYHVVAIVLLVMSLKRTRSTQDSCHNCPAGTFCGKNKDPICVPCPTNSFSSTSGQKACDICRQCAGCKDCDFGTFKDQKHSVCRPWTDCSLDGKSVLVNGTKETDVVCGPTSTDFSPGTSSVTTPIPATEPGHTPQVLVFFLALTSTTTLFLMFFLALHFSVVQQGRKKLLYIFKQPFMKPVRTAQEEDACSCRFPEEEEGECEL